MFVQTKEKMKKFKITYWVSTSLISLMMLSSAYMYLTAPQIKAGFVHLGFPDYFRVELAIAKFLGALALIIPIVSSRIKEWAYFGFFTCFVSALIAHISSGDPASVWAMVIIALVLLITSYFCYHKTQDAKNI